MKKEITICLGSSCFARGNKKTVKLIDDWIKEKKLENKVSFKGAHCFCNCENGPSIKIDNKAYQNINSDNIFDILSKEFDIQ